MSQILSILLIGFTTLGMISPNYQAGLQSSLIAIDSDKMVLTKDASNFQCQFQKMNTDEKTEVKKTVDSIIETMFRERKIKKAFERYFRFSKLSPKEKEAVDSIKLKYPEEEFAKTDTETLVRLLATGWNYNYQSILLAIGLKPLAQYDDAISEANSEINAERKRILIRRGLTEKDFYNILGSNDLENGKILKKDLTTLELIDTDLDSFIAKRINKDILNKNIAEMKRTAVVKKLSETGGELYGVGLKPIFELTFAKESSNWKIMRM